jgi:hypothetical protein
MKFTSTEKWDRFNVDIYHVVYYIDTCWYLSSFGILHWYMLIFIIIWDITWIHNHSTENPYWYPRWFNVHRFLTWNPKANSWDKHGKEFMDAPWIIQCYSYPMKLYGGAISIKLCQLSCIYHSSMFVK